MIEFHAVGAIVEGLLESDPVGGIMSVRQQWMSFGTQMTVDVQVSLRTRAWYNAGLLKVQLLLITIVLPASLSAVSRFRNSNLQCWEADANETTAVHGVFHQRSSCLFWI